MASNRSPLTLIYVNEWHEYKDDQGIVHRFRYPNCAPLNEANFDLEINFLEYWAHHPNGKIQHFSWVTDRFIQKDNVMALMRGLFMHYLIPDWEALYNAIAFGLKPTVIPFNSS